MRVLLTVIVIAARFGASATASSLRSLAADVPPAGQQSSSLEILSSLEEKDEANAAVSVLKAESLLRGGGPLGESLGTVRQAWRTAVVEELIRNMSDAHGLLPAQLTPKDDVEAKVAYRLWVANTLVFWLVWMVFSVCVYVSCYNFRVPLPDDSSKADPEETLEHGHCACLGESGDPIIFLCACFCPAIRWADTVSLAGLLRVGVAFCLCSLFFLMDGLVLPSLGFGIFFACTLLYYRQELRRKFGLPYGTLPICVKDFCFVFWCPWCAIAQEAIAVKQAYEIGHPAVRSGPARTTGSTWEGAREVQNFHYFVN